MHSCSKAVFPKHEEPPIGNVVKVVELKQAILVLESIKILPAGLLSAVYTLAQNDFKVWEALTSLAILVLTSCDKEIVCHFKPNYPPNRGSACRREQLLRVVFQTIDVWEHC